MAVCKSPQHIFENQFPENQTLLESVMSSWSQNVVNPAKQTQGSSFSEVFAQGSSFSEVFGDLYSKDGLSSQLHEQNLLSSSIDSSQMSTNKNQNKKENKKEEYPFSFPLGNNHYSSCSKIDIGFSLVKSESLQLCTEGLGSESSDDVEENFQVEMIKEEKMVSASVKHVASGTSSGELRRSRMSRQAFPPPLSFIGKSAKTGVCFTSYRQDGRFVLKEVRIPTQEFLQARREDGRLKLQIVQPNDYILEEEDEEFEEHDDDEEENEKIEEEN